MSQSMRTPKGIGIRAVAAAALYASKRDGQKTDETASDSAARDADKKKAALAQKPPSKD